jgi:hypothetical protein
VGVAALVAPVETLKRSLERYRDGPVGDAELAALDPLRQRRLDVVPQVQVDDLVVFGVVVDGRARNLDDARLDRVHQGEVRDDPGEDEALSVAGALQVVGRGREVVDRLDWGGLL